MRRMTIAFVALSAILVACELNGRDEEHQIVPLPACDWPIPIGLRLHVEEMTGHSYFWLKEGVFGQRVTFQPLPTEWADGVFQSSDTDELRLIEEIGPARIFSLRVFMESEKGQEVIDMEVDAYTVMLDSVMITTAGFSLPEVSAMAEHCIESQRELN